MKTSNKLNQAQFINRVKDKLFLNVTYNESSRKRRFANESCDIEQFFFIFFLYYFFILKHYLEIAVAFASVFLLLLMQM